jgi:hypothetical protein
MAAGAAPAPEKKLETKIESAEKPHEQPTTLRRRIAARLLEIFQGRDEYAGWRQ